MNAVELIEKLIKAGVSLADAFKKAKAKDGVDWETFLTSDVYTTTRDLITGLIGTLTVSDVDQALTRVREQEEALLRGRKVFELPIEDLDKYDALLTTENLLQDKLLATIDNRKSLWSWLIEEGAPALLKLAPVVLPLLL